MFELIISLVITAALIFAYRKVRTEMNDNKPLQTILCVMIAIFTAIAALYAVFSLIIVITP